MEELITQTELGSEGAKKIKDKINREKIHHINWIIVIQS